MDMAKSIDPAELASPFVVRGQLLENDILATDNGQRTTDNESYPPDSSRLIFNAC